MNSPTIRPKFLPLIDGETIAVQRSWFEALRVHVIAARTPDDAVALLNRIASECERALEAGQ